ncbi:MULTISPECIES: NUDIX domain-containing protein [unclassified Acinetobacter]|uniref:NUDIX hydrolase n=1 Tax=unclassified Acinetobacter TaxID=196816 RepID=UPI00244B3A59|nr:MULTISPECIES: NUDIX domain-containing protein [unclassified Acinetobacter]MDH0031651.1 NUDIX domain-containing protein [Acinetobacter sp. GD04021]MDH0887290.1 NUDIX domain-containing protein [Acinetobacter sp. GD03873]MDH1083741.1 NUDIX domain-containing protein [Acinetobacter sp. GD03983]MDH2190515.1 NUDIX domain-containing protein [Acinetobacter sp. GD03645]MDH2204268.1 NUDIX domain-containing protein [Acinetobacter sp. GD03647]
MTHIRTKALCIFRHQDKVLLSYGYDPSKNETYLRPIGGGIEFGETSVQAVEREVLEEIHQQIIRPKLLGVVENLFSFDGQQGHEIVFMYEAEFADSKFYRHVEIQGCEMDGSIYTACWMSQEQIEVNQYPVYPKGIEQWLFTESAE